MAPMRHVGRVTGTGSKTRTSDYYKRGDLVLVKTAEYPAWPAMISRPEDFKRTTDKWRYFVQLFGTHELTFVEPYNIQPFTGEVKIRPGGKSNVAKDFDKAMKEINETLERRRKSSLEANQMSARLEIDNKAPREQKTSALSETNDEDFVPSIRHLVELAKETKSKKALSQSLSQNVSTQGSLGTAAVVARDAFRGKVEILSDTKESIQSATRLAYDCVKNGMANEVIELITEKLENEPSMHGRVKYFFLVDSIMKRSHRKKEFSGESFITIVQDQLPRLLGAAAPIGVSPRENHKKCAKILRLWIKRKIMPESLLQPYVDDIELFIRNSSLDDRAVIGQSRVIYGMLIEEYGSNATLQLPGHFLSHVSIEEDEIPNISCNQEIEMKDVFLHHKDKKDVSAEGNGSHGRERNSPPPPPDSPPHTPPLPPLPLPPLPPNPPSLPPPPPPLPSQDPTQSSHLQRPLQPSMMGPWSQPLIPHGQPPPFSYFWRPA